MAAGKVTVVCDTQTPLAANDFFLSDPIQYENGNSGWSGDGFTAIMGFINSDQAGTLDIYQGTFAEVNAITGVAPAAGTGDSQMKHFTTTIAIGATNDGVNFTVPLVSQWVRVRFTNGVVNQTKFNLHAKNVQ